MALDLSNLVPIEDGVAMEVRHPQSGEPIMNGSGPVTVSLLGKDSDVYRRAVSEQARRRFKGARKPEVTADWDAEGLELLVACTVGWSGIEWEGEQLPYTSANARMLYSRLRWLREQAEEFILDRSNFFTESKAS